MMVEMMCGVMAGAPFGANIRRWGTTEKVADLVSLFCYMTSLECHLACVVC